MTYEPRPTDTTHITLSPRILALTEQLAEHAHEIWSQQRIEDGWQFGPQRDDATKAHPCLIPYAQLSDGEKQYDRNAALQTLKVISALGYRIIPPATAAGGDQAAIDAAELLLVRLKEAQTNAARSASGEPTKLELTELLQVWGLRQEDDPAWFALPELYRQLARRFLKLGVNPLAMEVARTALELTVPDGPDKSIPLWAGNDTVELRQTLGLALARAGNAEDAQQVLLALHAEGHVDQETLGTVGRTYKDQSQHWPEGHPERERLLKLSLPYYILAYERSDGVWTGINVATLHRLLGNLAESDSVARRIRSQCRDELTKLRSANATPEDCYWHLATLGEAALNLSDFDEAGQYYREAYAAAPKNFGDLNSTRRHARWLLNDAIARQTLKASDAGLLDQWMPIPRVAVFSGHMLDRPDRAIPRFPADQEDAVRSTIRDWLVQNNALIGYSSAACGGDLLFQEVLQELGGESRIVLPYGEQLFAADSVDFAGPRWIARYKKVLESATNLVVVSPHRTQGDGIAYDYANLVMHGLAAVRAAELQADQQAPIGLALWNGAPGDGPGGTASVVRRWRGLEMQVDQIQLSGTSSPLPERLPIVRNPVLPAEINPGSRDGVGETRIMAMVFGDAVNFSKLDEEQVSRFIQHFMSPIAVIVNSYGAANVVRNTWGDGLYLVFDHVRSAGLCALEICAFVRSRIPDGWRQHRLPDDLNVRLALHAGPVYSCKDPLTGQPNYTGTHVSRAARLEPKTPPGEVYASEAFAALCVEYGVTEFTCEYVKQLAWAKHYGTFPTFVLRRARTAPIRG